MPETAPRDVHGGRGVLPVPRTAPVFPVERRAGSAAWDEPGEDAAADRTVARGPEPGWRGVRVPGGRDLAERHHARVPVGPAPPDAVAGHPGDPGAAGAALGEPADDLQRKTPVHQAASAADPRHDHRGRADPAGLERIPHLAADPGARGGGGDEARARREDGTLPVFAAVASASVRKHVQGRRRAERAVELRHARAVDHHQPETAADPGGTRRRRAVRRRAAAEQGCVRGGAARRDVRRPDARDSELYGGRRRDTVHV